MKSSNMVYNISLDDLEIEAVLDSGFVESYSFSDELHAHAYYELILAVDGQISVEPITVTLQPHQMCLIPPGFYHRICCSGENAGKLAIRFHCTQKGKHPFVDRLEKCLVPITLEQQLHLSRTLLDLRRELRETNIARDQFANSLLEQCFILLYRALCKDSPQPLKRADQADSVRRLQIEEYLLNNFSKPITQQDLADYMYLSKRQTGRAVEAVYGKSFRKLLIEMRLQEAAGLLKNTELPIEGIALQVGYSSISGFYEAFRKFHGITAGSYRETYKNKP